MLTPRTCSLALLLGLLPIAAAHAETPSLAAAAEPGLAVPAPTRPHGPLAAEPAPAAAPATPPTVVPSPVAPREPRADEPAAQPPPAAPAAEPPAPQPAAATHRSPWSVQGDLRSMLSSWTWFDAGQGYQERYTYLGERLRGRLRYSHQAGSGPRVSGLIEVQGNLLSGLPARAIAPAPQGQLGLGGSFYATALRPSIASAGLRQAWIKVGSTPGSSVQLGRMEYSSGAEVKEDDEVLDWIQRARLKERLIGNFDFAEYGRTFDGIRLDHDTEEHRWTGFVARPTQGGFEPHFGVGMDHVLVANAAWTLKQSASHPDGEGQLFYNRYDDVRSTAFVDNRPAAQRGNVAAQQGIHLDTFGLHYMTHLGKQGDAVVWYAHQTGRWGTLTHQASAVLAEVGLRPSDAPWDPWVRASYYRSSGDGNPTDTRHGTFYAPESTGRIYARMPFYNLSNIQDTSLQLLLVPYKGALARFDLHALAVSSPQDLWYGGSGAFQGEGGSFGVSGRPTGGKRGLATLLDFSLEHSFSPTQSMTLYLGRAWGGPVVKQIYPANPNGSAMFLEYTIKKL